MYSTYLATKKRTSNQTLNPLSQRPFWFDLSNRFYEKLRQAAVEFQITRAEIVEEVLKVKLAESRQAKKPMPAAALKGKAREELIKDFLSRASHLRWHESREEDKRQPVTEDFSHLFWLDLPDSFYRSVRSHAARHGLSEKQFMTKALDQFVEQERKARRPIQPVSDVQEQIVKEFSRTAGKLRWKGKDEKARKAHARAMAKKRWENKQK